MKKYLSIDWHDDGATVKVENVSPLEIAAVLLSVAARDSSFGRALLKAAKKYDEISKAGGKLKYIKEIKDE